jgi:hypothetical protein
MKVLVLKNLRRFLVWIWLPNQKRTLIGTGKTNGLDPDSANIPLNLLPSHQTVKVTDAVIVERLKRQSD